MSSSSSSRKWKFSLKPNSSPKVVDPPMGLQKSSRSALTSSLNGVVAKSAEERRAYCQKEAMSMAYSPAKNIFTTGLMLWMSGSSIQIFSIYSTGMALVNPVTAMAKAPSMFKKFESEGVDVTVPLLIFVGLQLALLGIALWKCNSMGLLPMTSADWISAIPLREVLEKGAVSLGEL
jgi:ER membrane protein complex subunit 4